MLTAVTWLFPLVIVIVFGRPWVFVKAKFAGGKPGTVAETVYDPTVVLAVKTTDATPEAFVVAVAVVKPLAKVPLAGVGGAVKVTTTPAMMLLFPSRTVACNGVAKVVPTTALCGVPVGAIVVGTGTTTVRTKLADAVAAGEAESVTLKVKGVFTAGTVGVPVIAPVEGFKVNPFGRVLVLDHVYGVVPPLAAKVALYA